MTSTHTTLPELPRQNKQREADFGLLFRKWWEKNKIPGTFELKHSRGKDRFNLSEIHQKQKVIGSLIKSKDGCLLRVSSGTEGSPDYIGLIEFPVFVVIKFPKCFFIVPMQTIKDLILLGKKSVNVDDLIYMGYEKH